MAPSARTDRAVPHDLERLILWCLAKRPDDRPANARELRRGLAACADFGTWCEDEGLACQARELAAVERRRHEHGEPNADKTTRALPVDASPTRLTVELDARSLGE